MHADDDTGLSQLLWGRIASVDLGAGRVTVELGDAVTQPIPWVTGGSGKTRVWTRPAVGEQVMLLAPEGDIAGAVALRGLDCRSYPVVGDADRELITFEDGAALSYDPAAHALAVVLPAGATVSIVAPGGVKIDSDVRITGDLEVDGGVRVRRDVAADGDVRAGTVGLKSHRHLGVQPGSGLSQAPQP